MVTLGKNSVCSSSASLGAAGPSINGRGGEESRIREFVALLKLSRSSIQATVVELDFHSEEDADSEAEKKRQSSNYDEAACNEARIADLETAVLVQVLNNSTCVCSNCSFISL